MRLVRYGSPGQEKPGLIGPDGELRDLEAHAGEIAGDALSPVGLTYLAALNPESLPRVTDTTRLGPCIAPGSKVIGVGINYADLSEETGLEVPDEPVFFLRASSALAGAFDDLPKPPTAERLDYEVELGVVIGAQARNVSEEDAMAHVAGYCTVNDISDRGWEFDQQRQWVKGKSHDGFAPAGPWLVPAAEVPDPGALTLRSWVNGELRQHGSTGEMIFGISRIVSYISHFMTLEPGDLVSTGTPAGIGMGMDPPGYLGPGDIVEVEVEGLGRQRTLVTHWPADAPQTALRT